MTAAATALAQSRAARSAVAARPPRGTIQPSGCRSVREPASGWSAAAARGGAGAAPYAADQISLPSLRTGRPQASAPSEAGPSAGNGIPTHRLSWGPGVPGCSGLSPWPAGRRSPVRISVAARRPATNMPRFAAPPSRPRGSIRGLISTPWMPRGSPPSQPRREPAAGHLAASCATPPGCRSAWYRSGTSRRAYPGRRGTRLPQPCPAAPPGTPTQGRSHRRPRRWDRAARDRHA
jgi:hypothetical protein